MIESSKRRAVTTTEPLPDREPTKMPMEWTQGSVCIRPFRSSDIDPLFEAARESIADISPWLAWCHPGYSREESTDWVTTRAEAWAKDEQSSFAIVSAEDGRFLGGCGLNQIHPLHRFANPVTCR